MNVQDKVLEYYKFLVKLRNSGVTGMFGASPYLEEVYDLPREDALDILISWMNSFDLPENEQPDDGRNDKHDGRYDGRYDDYIEREG